MAQQRLQHCQQYWPEQHSSDMGLLRGDFGSPCVQAPFGEGARD